MTENFISVGRTSQGRPRGAREEEAMVYNGEERVMGDDEELGRRRRGIIYPTSPTSSGRGQLKLSIHRRYSRRRLCQKRERSPTLCSAAAAVRFLSSRSIVNVVVIVPVVVVVVV
jgi:hypothetical protein